MEKQLGVDLQMESLEGGLKELVMRWFTETQEPLIQNNGNFPEWFQGFTTRKDTEDLLKDKALGCFLIRLSDKAIGYILSYKGHDRCRHFVVTQNEGGQFMISGDSQTYHSLTELIEHYKVSPIQPFGEYLTSNCYEVNTSELYDVVNYNAKEKSGVSVQALRILWDQKKDHHSIPANKQRIQKQNDSAPVIPPSLPPKNQTKNRKLIGTVSVDTTSFSQVLPPVPKRGLPMGFIQGGSLPDTTTHPNETKAESNASKELRGNTNPAQTSDKNVFSTLDESDLLYTELSQMESRSKSLPQLDNSTVEDEYSNQLSSAPFTTSPSYSPSLGRRVTCHTYSLHDPRAPRLSDCSPDPQIDDSEGLMSNPLYQTSEEPGRSSDQQVDGMYAEVSQSSKSAGQPDNTYELIAGESASTVQSNTYESLADIKPKTAKSTWGKSNIKWRKFLPDYKKK